MRLSRESQDNYARAIDSLADAVDGAIADGLDGLRMQDAKGLHDFAMDMLGLDSLLEAATDDAAGISAHWYGEIREAMLGYPGRIAVDSRRVPEATDRAAWAIAHGAQENGLEWFKSELRKRGRYEVRRAAGESIISYGRNDGRKVRYARVPQYSKSYGDGCPFCRMLASRGFVYLSARSAGTDGHYHADCRCLTVPSFEDETVEVVTDAGGVRRLSLLEVEGYDPDALFDQYLDDLQTGVLDYSKLVKGAYGNTSHVGRWSSTVFADGSEMRAFVDGARDMADLQERCAVLEREWPKTGLSDKYFKNLQRHVQGKKRELMVGNRESGAISGGLNDINDPYHEKRDSHARMFYNEVRKRSRDTEVEAVSNNSGLSKDDVSKAYDHLFINKHQLEKGYERFDEDYYIAESWRRLRNGEQLFEHDLILIKHESFEYDLMKDGFSYEDAHQRAEKEYNYKKALTAFLDEA